MSRPVVGFRIRRTWCPDHVPLEIREDLSTEKLCGDGSGRITGYCDVCGKVLRGQRDDEPKDGLS